MSLFQQRSSQMTYKGNHIPYDTMGAITYPRPNLSLTMLVKTAPDVEVS